MVAVSVIIPVYNTAQYLRKCVDSVLMQTCKPYEILLVDDGSTDDSQALCDAYQREHPDMIKVIHQKNGGLSCARNSGLDVATGDYVAFVDSDDYISPEMLKKLGDLIEETGADIAVGQLCRIKETQESYIRPQEQTRIVWQREQALIELNSFKYFDLSVCNMLWKRTLFEGERFPLGKKSEDIYLLPHLFAKAEKVAFIAEPVYYYLQRQGSISRGDTVNTEIIAAGKSQLDFYAANFPELTYVAESAYVFFNLAVYNMYARRGLQCPDALMRDIRATAKQYFASTMGNRHIPLVKRVQLVCFRFAPPLYRAVICRKEHR